MIKWIVLLTVLLGCSDNKMLYKAKVVVREAPLLDRNITSLMLDKPKIIYFNDTVEVIDTSLTYSKVKSINYGEGYIYKPFLKRVVPKEKQFIEIPTNFSNLSIQYGDSIVYIPSKSYRISKNFIDKVIELGQIEIHEDLFQKDTILFEKDVYPFLTKTFNIDNKNIEKELKELLIPLIWPNPNTNKIHIKTINDEKIEAVLLKFNSSNINKAKFNSNGNIKWLNSDRTTFTIEYKSKELLNTPISVNIIPINVFYGMSITHKELDLLKLSKKNQTTITKQVFITNVEGVEFRFVDTLLGKTFSVWESELYPSLLLGFINDQLHFIKTKGWDSK